MWRIILCVRWHNYLTYPNLAWAVTRVLLHIQVAASHRCEGLPSPMQSESIVPQTIAFNRSTRQTILATNREVLSKRLLYAVCDVLDPRDMYHLQRNLEMSLYNADVPWMYWDNQFSPQFSHANMTGIVFHLDPLLWTSLWPFRAHYPTAPMTRCTYVMVVLVLLCHCHSIPVYQECCPPW